MPDLIVDVGNSLIKLALFQGKELVRTSRYAQVELDELQHFLGNDPVEAVGYASVGNNDDKLMSRLSELGELIRITAMAKLPIETTYESRETLGVDRIANAVAVRAKAGDRPSLAIDTGTCLTYDLVTADGVHLGGAISPGIRLRAAAMHEHSANLPFVLPEAEPAWIGVDTRTSLASGVFNGIAAEIDGFINQFSTVYGDLYVCITGGDAFTFQQVTKNTIFADPFLTLRGIHEILCNR